MNDYKKTFFFVGVYVLYIQYNTKSWPWASTHHLSLNKFSEVKHIVSVKDADFQIALWHI